MIIIKIFSNNFYHTFPISRNVCAICIRSLKSSVNSSSFVFNLFNFSTNVQSIHEINSTTNNDQAFGGIRGGQPKDF
jgi:hypothetical protein